ncbi:MAG: VOC family protein [Planctomycetota bacterium]|jgi:catechol 2,3-dioxygenase-like lactoylglutathione lyase family enzyme
MSAPKSRTFHAIILAILIVTWACYPTIGNQNPGAARQAEEHGAFTGELLPVFYVTDVAKSVRFYRDALGFELHHFFDYEAGRRVAEWTKPTPPIWAEMAAATQTFGLHLTQNKDGFVVGGMRHYFLVRDVEAHHRRVKSNGVDVGPLLDKPWMTMFMVTDPDGHEIFFGTQKD